MIELTIYSENPNDLLSTVLAELAHSFGGYKDRAEDFLDIFDKLAKSTDPEVIDEALIMFRAFVNRIEGASDSIDGMRQARLNAVNEAEGYNDYEDGEDDGYGYDDFDPNEREPGVDFEAPSAEDFKNMAAPGPLPPGTVFTLPNGPEGMWRALNSQAEHTAALEAEKIKADHLDRITEALINGYGLKQVIDAVSLRAVTEQALRNANAGRLAA